MQVFKSEDFDIISEYIQEIPSSIVQFKLVKMSPTPAEEVDLTSETPPRKMKQARLPFAPLNKQTTTSPAGKFLNIRFRAMVR